MRNSFLHLLGGLAILLILPVTNLLAQFDDPEPPVIRNIIVRFTGPTNVSEELVRSNLALRPGMLYEDIAIDRDIRSLYRAGWFEFIEVRTLEISAREVDLIFQVQPKFRIGSIRFDGNERVRDRRLRREISIRENTALNERDVKNDAEKLFEFYQKAGYSQARVDYSIERDPVTGFGTVTFLIDEGTRMRIGRVEFIGNEQVSTRALRRAMETRQWHMFSWLTGSGKFKDDTFEDDLEKLRDFYRQRGFLDIEVDPSRIEFTYPSRNRMVIRVAVNEGRQYRVGTIGFTGNDIYPSEVLRLVAKTRPGDVFSPEKLDEDIKSISDFYGQFGYLETRVRLQRNPNIETGDIDIVFNITENERFLVETINIEGNTKTKSLVIIRELALSPGTVFDSVRMEASRMRLENTRYFENVNLSPESTNIPNRRNLKVSVREGRTGNLTFGAGFSSLERAVFFVEVTQSNFDLFNRRSFFQGGGQKLRLRAQIGSRSNDIVLAFEEPWLFQQRLALGFQVYRSQSEFVSTIYDELRYGFEVYIRRRLIELIDSRISYRFETVDIYNISPFASPIFQEIAGKRSVSRLGLILLRDTRDSLITTTRGSYYEFGIEQAGGFLGGDVDYRRYEIRAAKYFPLFSWQRQVIEVMARTGVIKEFGDSPDVPFFDRFFLGGPNTMRGFEFRDVGPKDDFGQPVGGKTYGLLTVEYSIDIVAPVRFALFYDAGFINRTAFNWDAAAYNDNVGFGIRFFVLGSPLRLDYGIPITTDRFNNRGKQFNFSFGSRF